MRLSRWFACALACAVGAVFEPAAALTPQLTNNPADVADIPACTVLAPSDTATALKMSFVEWGTLVNAATHSECYYGFADKTGAKHYIDVTLSHWVSPAAARQGFTSLRQPAAGQRDSTHDIKGLGDAAYYYPTEDGPAEVMPGAMVVVLDKDNSFSILVLTPDASAVPLGHQIAVAKTIVAALEKHS